MELIGFVNSPDLQFLRARQRANSRDSEHADMYSVYRNFVKINEGGVAGSRAWQGRVSILGGERYVSFVRVKQALAEYDK